MPVSRKTDWSFCVISITSKIDVATYMLQKFWKFDLYRFNVYKHVTQFLQYMCAGNGFAWLSFDDFDCNEKSL